VAEWRVGVIGATSLVGECVIPLLINDGRRVFAFSRKVHDLRTEMGVTWLHYTSSESPIHSKALQIKDWLCVAPIWILPQYFSMLEAYGARRVVVLSSTSRFTKADSSEAAESDVAARLVEGEERLQTWAKNKGIEWVILRPTLIYGLGKDKNIAEIIQFIRRFGFFPLLGKAMGLRQPIHVEDVAVASLAALKSPIATNHAYNISGGETLPYKEMISRVFAALRRRPRLVTIPLIIFKLALTCLSVLPRYRHWSAAMAERMNHDMVFDHSDATRDFGFSPRTFQLTPEEISR